MNWLRVSLSQKELNGFTSKGKTYALGDTFAIGNAQGLAAYNALPGLTQ